MVAVAGRSRPGFRSLRHRHGGAGAARTAAKADVSPVGAAAKSTRPALSRILRRPRIAHLGTHGAGGQASMNDVDARGKSSHRAVPGDLLNAWLKLPEAHRSSASPAGTGPRTSPVAPVLGRQRLAALPPKPRPRTGAGRRDDTGPGTPSPPATHRLERPRAQVRQKIPDSGARRGRDPPPPSWSSPMEAVAAPSGQDDAGRAASSWTGPWDGADSCHGPE